MTGKATVVVHLLQHSRANLLTGVSKNLRMATYTANPQWRYLDACTTTRCRPQRLAIVLYMRDLDVNSERTEGQGRRSSFRTLSE